MAKESASAEYAEVVESVCRELRVFHRKDALFSVIEREHGVKLDPRLRYAVAHALFLFAQTNFREKLEHGAAEKARRDIRNKVSLLVGAIERQRNSYLAARRTGIEREDSHPAGIIGIVQASADHFLGDANLPGDERLASVVCALEQALRTALERLKPKTAPTKHLGRLFDTMASIYAQSGGVVSVSDGARFACFVRTIFEATPRELRVHINSRVSKNIQEWFALTRPSERQRRKSSTADPVDSAPPADAYAKRRRQSPKNSPKKS